MQTLLSVFDLFEFTILIQNKEIKNKLVVFCCTPIIAKLPEIDRFDDQKNKQSSNPPHTN